MNLGIKIGDDFLDLLPGTQLQVEENNPFLQVTSELQGQFSLPFSVPITDKNLRLLQFAGQLQVLKENIKIPAVAYEGNFQHSNGVIMIEQINGNLNFSKNGTISLFYLYGISDFYQLVKNKRLTDIDYGVKETYAWTDLVYNDNGIHAHLHRVMFTGNQDLYPYAIFEVNNPGDISPTIYNDGTVVDKNYNYVSIYPDTVLGNPYSPEGMILVQTPNNKIVPFPYLAFTLKKIFESVGWVLKGDILNDPDFRKIVLIHSQPIPASYFDEHGTVVGATTEINLTNLMPNVTVSGFLMALKTRLGWWYDFDFNKKICTIRFVKNVFSTRNRKDFTVFINATYRLKISSDKKIYTVSASQGEMQPDWSILNVKGVKAKFLDLPSLSTAIINDAWFVLGENSWYICAQLNDESGTEWQKSVGNTFGYENPDGTDSISTNCNIPDMNDFDLRQAMVTTSRRIKVIPCVDIPADNGQTDTFYICYHHGPVLTWNKDSLADIEYPYGSPSPYNPQGIKIGNSTLSFFLEQLDGTDIGLYPNYLQSFLEALNEQELATFDFFFNLVELKNLNLLDSFVIKGTEWFFKTIRRNIPAGNSLQADCIRLK